MSEEKKNRVSITIDISNDVLFDLMLLAHERDITLNDLINDILRDFMNKENEKSVEKSS